MKKIGLDTSVLLRLLVGEPMKQARSAKKFIEESFVDGTSLVVSDFVVIEAYHALLYHYDVPKNEALKQLFDLLSSPYVVAKGNSMKVLREYFGKGAGLVDRLIRFDYLEKSDAIATFDNDFSKLENMILLS